jgi:hypothetical protein
MPVGELEKERMRDLKFNYKQKVKRVFKQKLKRIFKQKIYNAGGNRKIVHS